MSKALIVFALLGLFSFRSYAAPDDGSSCAQKAADAETATVRFIGASGCSQVGSIFTGNDHCEVRATPGATCSQDASGVWTGQPYYFTGCLAGSACSPDPDPDPQPDPEPDNAQQLRPISLVQVGHTTGSNVSAIISETSVNVDDGFRKLSLNQIELSKNDHIINETVLQASRRTMLLADSTQTNFVTVLNRLSQNHTEQEQSTAAFAQTLREVNSSILQSTNGTNTKLDEVKEAQTTAQTSIDTITNTKLPEIKLAADNALYWGRLTYEHAVEADGQSEVGRDAAIEAAEWASQGYFNSIGTLENTQIILGQLYELIENGGGSDGGDGGSGSSQTDSLLSSIKTDINTSTNRIVDAVNNPSYAITNQITLSGISNQLDGLYSMTNGNASNLSNQLGQQLNQIKTAIENSDSGGGSGGTGSNKDITDRIDTTNYELSELRQLLDFRSQVANQSLAGIGAAIQGLGTAGTAQGEKLTEISGTLTGIGETLDGLTEGLQGPAMTEADFNPESGVLSALGISGDESVADLTDLPVRLHDYRNQYGTFLTGTCPENIPVQFRLFGSSYSFNFYYKPVCDFMAIAGTILNFAVWFGVPFIVFGSRRVS